MEKLRLYEEKAQEIIQLVSELIMEHYDITPKNLDGTNEIECPAVINGVPYYDLEGEVADIIKELVKNENKEDNLTK